MTDWKRYGVRWFCDDCNAHHDVDFDAPSPSAAATHVLMCLCLVKGPPPIVAVVVGAATGYRIGPDKVVTAADYRFEIPITFAVELLGEAITDALPVWTNPEDFHGPN